LRLGVGFRHLDGLPRGGGFRLRAGLQRSFGFANPLQATLASLQFRRQLVATPIRAVLRILQDGKLRGQEMILIQPRTTGTAQAVLRLEVSR
jgi:hypothetical protein